MAEIAPSRVPLAVEPAAAGDVERKSRRDSVARCTREQVEEPIGQERRGVLRLLRLDSDVVERRVAVGPLPAKRPARRQPLDGLGDARARRSGIAERGKRHELAGVGVAGDQIGVGKRRIGDRIEQGVPNARARSHRDRLNHPPGGIDEIEAADHTLPEQDNTQVGVVLRRHADRPQHVRALVRVGEQRDLGAEDRDLLVDADPRVPVAGTDPVLAQVAGLVPAAQSDDIGHLTQPRHEVQQRGRLQFDVAVERVLLALEREEEPAVRDSRDVAVMAWFHCQHEHWTPARRAGFSLRVPVAVASTLQPAPVAEVADHSAEQSDHRAHHDPEALDLARPRHVRVHSEDARDQGER